MYIFSARFFIRSLAVCLAICMYINYTFTIPQINLFRASDRVLMPEPTPEATIQLSVISEEAFNIIGVQADDGDSGKDRSFDSRKVNVLQLWQCNQDALAAFKGCPFNSSKGQISQLFNINDDNTTHGLFKPLGKFSVPLNLMFAARYYFNHGFSIGAFLSYYHMKLSNVQFIEQNSHTLFEDNIFSRNNLLRENNLGGIFLGGWERTGISDLLIQMRWIEDYPQCRPLLINVRPQARFGISIPTGKKQDEDLLLGVPFGNDGSWGLQISGGLDLTFSSCVRGGIDAEFLYLFGNIRSRRIKTDLAQTDLLFVNKLLAFKEYGLVQQYNLYLEVPLYFSGLWFKLNYQHLKTNESKLYVCSDSLDPLVYNNAESLEEWSINSLIFNIRYDFDAIKPRSFSPSLQAWYKYGIIGKRALLADTVGIALHVSF